MESCIRKENKQIKHREDQEYDDDEDSGNDSSLICSDSSSENAQGEYEVKEEQDLTDNNEKIKWEKWDENKEYKTKLFSDWIKNEMDIEEPINLKNIPYEIIENPTPYGIFSLFLDGFWEIIENETSKYYNQTIETLKEKNIIKPKSRYLQWKNPTINELKTFHGIILWMGIKSSPNMDDNWSNNELFKSNFHKYMSYNRFSMLLRFLHVNNNSKTVEGDLLYKIRPLLDMLNTKFEKFYNSNKKLCIDECMIKFNGVLKFKQYIMNKPVKFGIKGFLICDSNSYYCHKIIIYTGANDNNKEKNVKPLYSPTELTLMSLVENHLKKNKIIFMDNYFVTTKIARYFSSKQTGLIGTLRKNRLNSENIIPEPKNKKEYIFYISENRDLVLTLVNDRTQVKFLSNVEMPTIIEHERKRNGKLVTEKVPKVMLDYNYNARGVDFCNERTTYYRFPHGNRKWWRPIYLHLIQLAINNSYVIYLELSKSKMTYKTFYSSIINNLLGNPKTQKKSKYYHFPNFIEAEIEGGNKQRKRLNCNYPGCKKLSMWKCVECSKTNKSIVLCLPTCFEKFHKEKLNE